MGFTLCSKFFISYTQRQEQNYTEYDLYIWRFIPGQKLQYISKHRIFKLVEDCFDIDNVVLMQVPTDPHKIICYASGCFDPVTVFLTVLTLPTTSCKSCKSTNFVINHNFTEGWCSKHGFIMDFMFTLSYPEPVFNPHISLAYPDHIVINTGHCIHILNFATVEPVKTIISLTHEYESQKQSVSNCTDNAKQDESPKWIKKIVKRYSSGDFENCSLLSGQSRDDYNEQIELPILVQGLNEQNLDVISEAKSDHVFETQLIITQRTLDCDQFVQNTAQKLCFEAQLKFLHCEDYYIKIIHICPLNGHIVCKAVIEIAALDDLVPFVKHNVYVTKFIFTWNIVDNIFNVIELSEKLELKSFSPSPKLPILKNIPSIVHRKVLVMGHFYNESERNSLKDYNNCYAICMIGDSDFLFGEEYEFSISSDSDLEF